jgi:hypothetical protein
MANDHWVPQFLLKNFRCDRPGKIWWYERGKLPRRVGIKSVASEEYYYSIRAIIPGLKKSAVDDLYKVMESQSSRIIPGLLSSTNLTLTDKERATLSQFIAHLYTRSPFARKRLTNVHIATNEVLLKFSALDEKGFKKRAKKAGMKENVQKLRQLILGDQISLRHEDGEHEDFFLHTAFTLGEELKSLISSKEWTLVETGSAKRFITSDNPVFLFPPHDGYRGPLGPKDAVVVLPLSPTKMFLMANCESNAKIANGSAASVDTINHYALRYAHRQVYASFECKEIQEGFDETVLDHNTDIKIVGDLR